MGCQSGLAPEVWQEKVGTMWQMSQIGTNLLAGSSSGLEFQCSYRPLPASNPESQQGLQPPGYPPRSHGLGNTVRGPLGLLEDGWEVHSDAAMAAWTCWGPP